MPPPLTFTFETVDAIARHIEQAQIYRPGEEVGGLLLAGHGMIKGSVDVPNAASDPYQGWEGSPELISGSLKRYEDLGLVLAGTYHSHPFGETNMSAADVGLGQVGVLLLVAAPLNRSRDRWEWKLHVRDRGDSPLDLAILPPRSLPA